jgi:hypothetical protein
LEYYIIEGENTVCDQASPARNQKQGSASRSSAGEDGWFLSADNEFEKMNSPAERTVKQRRTGRFDPE